MASFRAIRRTAQSNVCVSSAADSSRPIRKSGRVASAVLYFASDKSAFTMEAELSIDREMNEI